MLASMQILKCNHRPVYVYMNDRLREGGSNFPWPHSSTMHVLPLYYAGVITNYHYGNIYPYYLLLYCGSTYIASGLLETMTKLLRSMPCLCHGQ